MFDMLSYVISYNAQNHYIVISLHFSGKKSDEIEMTQDQA